MRSDRFETFLQELRAADHYSLAAMIELPLIGEEHPVPLRFCPTSCIELKHGPEARGNRMSESWLYQLMERVTAEHAFIRMTVGEALRFAVSLKGDLRFKGSGRDIELIRSEDPRVRGLYFEVSHLTVTNTCSLLFQHPERRVDMTSGLGAYIAASHEKIDPWIQKQRGFVIA